MNYFKSHLPALFFFAIASIFLVSCEDDSKLPPTNYCGDNIMNHGETGVDCGGPCWPCDPSCSDGIQNGSETGVDCGGSCTPCASSCSDGIQNGDETGVDCGGSCPDACATCTDGIMNGDEEGIDCGGSCPDVCPEPTCTDGIMNGTETGIDCGGDDCPDCPDPSCTDGVMNGTETGVDCGGDDCPACPTCTDGIQNGDEEGVDCGGSCPDTCPPPPTGEYLTADLNGNAFAANLVLGELLNSGTTIGFQSDQSQDNQMFFRVPSDVALGTYDLVATSGFSAEFKQFNHGIYTTESGTITITNHDTVNQMLNGTFEFTAVEYDTDGVTVLDTAVIINGTFGVEYF